MNIIIDQGQKHLCSKIFLFHQKKSLRLDFATSTGVKKRLIKSSCGLGTFGPKNHATFTSSFSIKP